MTVLTDTQLRGLNFIGAFFGMILLISSVYMKMRPRRMLTKGELLVRGGFLMLLFSIFYGTGEKLWHWYHLTLWMISLSVLWTVIGLAYVIYEALVQRKTPPKETK